MRNSAYWEITSTDLDQWAVRQEARTILPRLVRRLIHATAAKIYRIGFPADEGTQLGGYDGIVQLEGGLPHAPDGQSVWEMGVNKGVKGKADDDYEKRKKELLGVDPKDTTFVFVTPRRWGGKDKWRTARRNEAFWKDVWVLDADDLEQWLEQAPAVAAWLGKVIGKRFDEVTDLQEAWAAWSQRAQPNISTTLILSARTQAEDALARWLDAPASAIRLRAATTEEAIAYFAGFVLSRPLDQQIGLLARTVVVSSATALARLTISKRPLIIIPSGDWDAQPHLAVRNGHHVLLPVGAEVPEDVKDVRLSKIPRREFEKALLEMGLTEDRAREVTKESHGQLAILIRLLGRGPTMTVPTWVTPVEAGRVAPLLLAGAWDRNQAADRQAVERLAGKTYSEVEEVAVRWHSTSNSPLGLTGSVWQWISRDDGWHHLWNRLSPTLLDTFTETAIEVLGTPDPRFNLAPDQRWAAAVHGQVLPHSGHLREALAHSLVLLAINATAGVGAGGHQGRVDGVIRRLLGRERTPNLWPSLSTLLPLLAEAAPDVFLDCLEEAILRDNEARHAMFEQEGMWGGSPHTGLLWALENLAWSPLYLTRVTVALGRLAEHDPGGRSANRPIASLHEIFLPWLPHTRATLSQRLQAIDVLAARAPRAAWELCVRLIPKGAEHSMNTHLPRWRGWKETGADRVNSREYWNAVSALTERLIAWVGMEGKRWTQLLEELPRIPQSLVPRLIEELRRFVESTAPAEDRLLVWEALRKALHFQRHVLKSRKQRLLAAMCDTLDNLYCRLEPTAIRPRVAWLFTARPELPDLAGDDWRKNLEAIAQARRQAIDAVVAAEGPNGLLLLADEVDQAASVGLAVGTSAMPETQIVPLLDACLVSATGKRAECGRGLIVGRFSQTGPGWPQTFFSGPGREWPTQQRVAFALGLPPTAETWDLVASWGTEAEHAYWRSVPINWLDQPARDAERCISSLAAVGRPWAALDLMGMCLCGTPPNATPPPVLVVNVLHAASQSDPSGESVPISRNSLHCLNYSLDYLETTGEVDEAEIAHLEFLFLPVLRHLRRSQLVLHRMLAREPAMFVDVLAAAFRSENEETSEPDAQTVARAKHAYDLLESWRIVPGTQSNGSLDADALNLWVNDARHDFQARGYCALGDQQIGQILSRAPAGSDGHWPHDAVRDLVERLESEEFERGLYVGLRNSRGPTSRTLDAGGRQEHDLAARYSQAASTLASRFHRTARVLGQIAAAYERDAQREDHESALMEYE